MRLLAVDFALTYDPDMCLVKTRNPTGKLDFHADVNIYMTALGYQSLNDYLQTLQYAPITHDLYRRAEAEINWHLFPKLIREEQLSDKPYGDEHVVIEKNDLFETYEMVRNGLLYARLSSRC